MKIPKIPIGTPVIIHWFDAHEGQDSGGHPKQLTKTDCELLDVGFFVGAKGKFVTIAVEKDAEDAGDYFRHTHHIPKVNITRVEVLSGS